MGFLGNLIKAVSDMVTGSRRRGGASAPEVLPGESGPDASVEVDPHRIGPVRMSYSPQADGAPDPGEVVWTWVPFEENDGRGKDRPVLVVAAESAGPYLAVQLTSKDHDGQGDFLPIGPGGGVHREAGDPGTRGRDARGSGDPAPRAVRAGHRPAAPALRLALTGPA